MGGQGKGAGAGSLCSDSGGVDGARDSHGTFSPRTWGQRKPKTTAGLANEEHILTEYRSILG
jgi:hypothetical protein